MTQTILRPILITLLALCLWLGGNLTPEQAAIAASIDAQFESKVLEVIRQNPEVIIESLQVYQARQQALQQQQQQAILDAMKANPREIIGSSPTLGATEQDVVMVMFSDFQCPFCAEAHKTLKSFIRQHQDRVTFVYKHLPLTQIHDQAYPAALAAWAAYQQGKFWEYHDALFEQQDQLGEELYLKIARRLGLKIEQFNGDRTSEAAERAITEDIQLAQSLGLRGTPFFAINGEPIPGAVSLQDFEAVLAQVLN
ncbi:thioredoxin domain-containing protein [Spirulina subsalsa FACHB-351]|uniref:Thioredoxin domain-containing protein n=1 Tax=Spirulina subsalsa FACHB-351 TaxID=234711 RepID=A0ABT3L8G4_9CYAN|nr:thioredoxin domain-containing protein [Spirulina subsalsa]MCW6037784.1 thioredoxin domain-containing protein [Spirulina subsalsa FACHB-351]